MFLNVLCLKEVILMPVLTMVFAKKLLPSLASSLTSITSVAVPPEMETPLPRESSKQASPPARSEKRVEASLTNAEQVCLRLQICLSERECRCIWELARAGRHYPSLNTSENSVCFRIVVMLRFYGEIGTLSLTELIHLFSN